MSDGARRRGEGALARREKRLAYSLLLPTFALVLGVIPVSYTHLTLPTKA